MCHMTLDECRQQLIEAGYVEGPFGWFRGRQRALIGRDGWRPHGYFIAYL